jgi:hypothetical protein
MNRKKKINKILGKKMRKANAKLAPKSNKPAYISKANRVEAEIESIENTQVESKE